MFRKGLIQQFNHRLKGLDSFYLSVLPSMGLASPKARIFQRCKRATAAAGVYASLFTSKRKDSIIDQTFTPNVLQSSVTESVYEVLIPMVGLTGLAWDRVIVSSLEPTIESGSLESPVRNQSRQKGGLMLGRQLINIHTVCGHLQNSAEPLSALLLLILGV